MNKYIWIVIGVVVLVLIGNGVYAYFNNKGGVMQYDEVKNKEFMMDDSEKNSEMMKDETGMMDKGDIMMKSGSYETYAPEKIARANSEQDVVLFFRAGWCPTCRAVDADIKTNLSEIPTNLTILDVDYDNSTALKKEYGVTYQHTFVQVDGDGKLIKKWSGSPTLTALVSELK